jgi:predicted nucleotidyltransferase
MTRHRKEKATHTIPNWATLCPPVTDALLADITQRIVEKFQPYKVVLFGSYAYGTPNLDSDVDLLVVMDSDEPMVQRIRRVREVAKVRFLPMDVAVLIRYPGMTATVAEAKEAVNTMRRLRTIVRRKLGL